MPDAERQAWTAGIDAYAPYSKRDLLFDAGMVEIKEVLRTAESRASLDGLPLDATVSGTLDRLMPIYRKHWWPAHDRTNRDWIAAVRPLLDRHGRALNDAIARAYGVTPDNPFGSTCLFARTRSGRTRWGRSHTW